MGGLEAVKGESAGGAENEGEGPRLWMRPRAEALNASARSLSSTSLARRSASASVKSS